MSSRHHTAPPCERMAGAGAATHLISECISRRQPLAVRPMPCAMALQSRPGDTGAGQWVGVAEGHGLARSTHRGYRLEPSAALRLQSAAGAAAADSAQKCTAPGTVRVCGPGGRRIPQSAQHTHPAASATVGHSPATTLAEPLRRRTQESPHAWWARSRRLSSHVVHGPIRRSAPSFAHRMLHCTGEASLPRNTATCVQFSDARSEGRGQVRQRAQVDCLASATDLLRTAPRARAVSRPPPATTAPVARRPAAARTRKSTAKRCGRSPARPPPPPSSGPARQSQPLVRSKG